LDNGELLCWGDSNYGSATPTLPEGRTVKFITGMDN